MRSILLGPPGAGKGTQAQGLARHLGVPHVATGDLFRLHLEKGTELGKKAKSYMEQGLLVPDEVTIAMLLERLQQADCRQGYVLDGFPRNIAQAEALDGASHNGGVDVALLISVSDKELTKRLGGRLVCRSCQAPYHATNLPPKVAGRCDRCGGKLYQRPDDAPEAIRKRIQVYFSETAPLMGYYRKQGKLVEVDGERSIEEVGQSLTDAVKSRVGGRQ